MVELRNYQHQLLYGAYGHFKKGVRTVAIESCPGTGKTVIAARAIADATSRGKRCLFLAHRKELVTQPRDKLRDMFGIHAGIIKSGFPFEPHLPVQIASVQTLVGKLGQIEPPDLIIVDEAHHSVAGTWDKILSAFPNALVLGLSGTPMRSDGTGLEDTFEVMVNGPPVPWHIEQGNLVPTVVHGCEGRIKVAISGGDYDPNELVKALERKGLDGDPLHFYRMYFKPEDPVVAFGPTVEYCNKQAERFRKAGIRAFSLSAETPDEERDRVIAGLSNGETQVLWNVDIVGEGTDIPAIGGMIDCSKTTSRIKYLQRAARSARPSPGKTHAIYLDLVGNAAEHGHPDIERKWSLKGKAKAERKHEVDEEGRHLSTRDCGKCFATYPTARFCPYCGHDNKEDRRISMAKAEELAILTKEAIDKAQEEAKKAKAALRKEEEKRCQSLADFIALGRERKYENPVGWARVKWDLRQGKAPGGRGKPAYARRPQKPQIGAGGWPL